MLCSLCSTQEMTVFSSAKTGSWLSSLEAFISGPSLPYLLSLFLTSLELAGGCVQTGASNLLQLGYLWPGARDTWNQAHAGSGDMKGLLSSWQPRLREVQGILVKLTSPLTKQGAVLPLVGNLDTMVQSTWPSSAMQCSEHAQLEVARKTMFPQIFPGIPGPYDSDFQAFMMVISGWEGSPVQSNIPVASRCLTWVLSTKLMYSQA